MIKHKWVLTGALSLGLAGTVPLASAASRDDRIGRDQATERRDREEPREQQQLRQDQRARTAQDANRETENRVQSRLVEVSELPEKVREGFNRHKGDARITKVIHVKFDEGEFYRARVEGDRGVRFVRVDEKGELIEIGKPGQAYVNVQFENLPAEVKQTIRDESQNRFIEHITAQRDREENQTIYVVELRNGDSFEVNNEGRLTRESPVLLSSRALDREWDDFDSGNDVRYETLPGEVKHAVGQRLGQNDRVTEAVQIRRDSQTQYLVRVQSGERSRLLRVSQDGRILADRNVTEEGRVRVDYNSLPGEVKSTLSRQAGGGNIDRVVQVTRDNRTWYVARIRDGNQMRVIRVDSGGKVVTPQDLNLDRDQPRQRDLR